MTWPASVLFLVCRADQSICTGTAHVQTGAQIDFGLNLKSESFKMKKKFFKLSFDTQQQRRFMFWIRLSFRESFKPELVYDRVSSEDQVTKCTTVEAVPKANRPISQFVCTRPDVDPHRREGYRII